MAAASLLDGPQPVRVPGVSKVRLTAPLALLPQEVGQNEVPSASHRKRASGEPARHIAANSPTKPPDVTPRWDSSAMPRKLLRLRSSISGCSGSTPAGGRLYVSPPSTNVDANLPPTARFQTCGFATIACRIC